MTRLRAIERMLETPAEGDFGEGELAGLPDPVRRMFCGAIAPGTPLATSARIAMRGRLKLRNWTRFTGTELLAPHRGFVWAARARLISGYDRYVDGEGEMRWKLLGLIPVVRAGGPDVSRSAAGRAGGEGVWVPTALLPRFGVEWSVIDDHHVICRLRLGRLDLEYHHLLDDEARVVTTWFDRWGDPDATGVHALHPFGVETSSFRTFGGLTIPAAGRAGWHYGTSRFEDGVFFEYEITELQPRG